MRKKVIALMLIVNLFVLFSIGSIYAESSNNLVEQDDVNPKVTSIEVEIPGLYNIPGEIILIKVTFDEDVEVGVGGALVLDLPGNPVATYEPGIDLRTHSFIYTVEADIPMQLLGVLEFNDRDLIRDITPNSTEAGNSVEAFEAVLLSDVMVGNMVKPLVDSMQIVTNINPYPIDENIFIGSSSYAINNITIVSLPDPLLGVLEINDNGTFRALAIDEVIEANRLKDLYIRVEEDTTVLEGSFIWKCDYAFDISSNEASVALVLHLSDVGYIALGDSITTGYLLDNVMEESFVYKLDKVLPGTVLNASQNGMQVIDLRNYLMLISDEEKAVFAKADTLTLTIGGNHLLKPLIDYISNYTMMNSLGVYHEPMIQEAIQYLIDNPTNGLVLIGEMTNGLDEFISNYPLLIADIRAINPDAELLVQTVYNPLNEMLPLLGFDLTSPNYMMLNEGLDNLFLTMNTVIKATVDENIKVIDVYEAFKNDNNMTINMDKLDIHPNMFGNEYIYLLNHLAINDNIANVSVTNGSFEQSFSLADGELTIDITPNSNTRGSAIKAEANMITGQVIDLVLTDNKVIIPWTEISMYTSVEIAYKIKSNPKPYVAEEIEVEEVIDVIEEAIAEEIVMFTDIKGWYYDYIIYLSNGKIMKGVGNGLFDPKGSMTRAEVIQVLANMSEVDQSTYKKSGFDDVDINKWYGPALSWAKENGIAIGYMNKFSPEDLVSRQDLLVMISRYVETIDINLLNSDMNNDLKSVYKDVVLINDYALDSVQKMTNHKIITGTPEGNFLPKNNASRGEAAKIFALINQLIKE